MKRAGSFLESSDPIKYAKTEETENVYQAPIDTFPTEVAQLIFAQLPPSGLDAAMLVSRKWRNEILNSTNSELKQNVECYQRMVGPRQLSSGLKLKFSDDRILEGLKVLPDNIFAILKAASPIGNAEDKSSVSETHMCTYIAPEVNILHLGELVQIALDLVMKGVQLDDEAYQGIEHIFGFNLGADEAIKKMKHKVEAHEWALLSKRVIPNSEGEESHNAKIVNQFVDDQFEKSGVLYEIPSPLAIIYSLFCDALNTGNRQFENTYIAGLECDGLNGYPQIGEFDDAGLRIYERNEEGILNVGVAPVQIFKN